MRKMSFALTTEQILERSKLVTRRFGWWKLKTGDRVLPVEKSMGLKKGEKVKPLLPDGVHLIIVSTRTEPLNAITQEECILEGFPDLSPSEFVDMLVKKYKCEPTKPVNRILFAYSDEVLASIDAQGNPPEVKEAINALILFGHSKLKTESLLRDRALTLNGK